LAITPVRFGASIAAVSNALSVRTTPRIDSRLSPFASSVATSALQSSRSSVDITREPSAGLT
jgi:hypothetical protein